MYSELSARFFLPERNNTCGRAERRACAHAHVRAYTRNGRTAKKDTSSDARGGSDAKGHGIRALIAFNKANNSELIRGPPAEGIREEGASLCMSESYLRARRAKQKTRKSPVRKDGEEASDREQ